MGLTQTQAAEFAGVERKTLYNWRHKDPDFGDCLRAAQQAIWRTSVDRVRALLPHAISALQSDLSDLHVPTRARAAATVFRLASLREVVRPD